MAEGLASPCWLSRAPSCSSDLGLPFPASPREHGWLAPFPGDALGRVHCDACPDLRGVPEKRCEKRSSYGTSGTFGSALAWEGDQSASGTMSLRSPKGLSEASWSKAFILGTSVVVQRLGLQASEAGGVGSSLVGKRRSHKPCGVA